MDGLESGLRRFSLDLGGFFFWHPDFVADVKTATTIQSTSSAGDPVPAHKHRKECAVLPKIISLLALCAVDGRGRHGDVHSQQCRLVGEIAGLYFWEAVKQHGALGLDDTPSNTNVEAADSGKVRGPSAKYPRLKLRA